MGDSFLVAQALRDEDLMTARVESALRRGGVDAQVFNLSVIDYGTAQELLLLRQVGGSLAPESVVLVLYPANDVVNNSRVLAGTTRVSPGDALRPYLVRRSGEWSVSYTHPLRARLRRSSAVFAHLERAALSRGWISTFPPMPGAALRLRMGRAPRESLEVFRSHLRGTAWRTAWEDTFDLLRAFRDDCRSLGARLLVLVVPDVQQVIRTAKTIRLDLELRSRGQGALAGWLDWSRPETVLAAFFAEEQIDATLLLAPLREAAGRGVRVYTRDEHLAAAGHEIASRLVLDWLRGRGAGSRVALGAVEPVSIPPPVTTPSGLVSFGALEHADLLGDGWLLWQGRSEAVEWGWRIGPTALIALPAAGPDLLVRGVVPGDADLPVAGVAALVGGEQRPLHLDRTGPFEIRIALGADSAPTSDGFRAVVLAPGVTARVDDWPVGLIVQEIGFVPEADRGPREP